MINLHKFPQRWLKTGIVILISILAVFTIVKATPPTSPYAPGDTLDPGCAPGSTNCTVSTASSTWTNSGTYLYPSSTTWFVGIGTTTPATPLDVNGSSTIRNNLRLTILAGATGCLSVDADGDITTSTCSGGTDVSFPIPYASTTGVQASLTFPLIYASTTHITATSPLTISSGVLSMPTSTASQDGFLKATDWLTFNSKITTTSLSVAYTPLAYNQTTGVFSLPTSTSGQSGFLSSGDWSIFNTKQNALTFPLASASSSAAGSTTQLQFNNGGLFSGDANLTWASSTQLLTISGTSTISGALSIGTTTISTLFSIATTTNIFNVLSSGRVGIGTSTPQAALHIGTASTTKITSPSNALMVSGELEVAGSAYFGAMEFPTDSGVISWIDMPVSTSVATSTVESYSARLGGTNILTIYGLASGGAGGITNPRVGIGTTTPSEVLTVNGGLFVGTSTIPTLYVASTTGRVGIGTSTPISLLEILSTTPTFTITNSTVSSTANTILGNYRFNNSVGNQTIFSQISALSTNITSSSEGGALTFSTMKAGTLTEAMRITSSSYVGIGTTTPAYALQIAGSIVPTANNLYSLGTSTLKWANLYAATTTVGDLVFGNDFRITEDYETPQALIFRNHKGDEIMRLDENGNLVVSGSVSSASSTATSTVASSTVAENGDGLGIIGSLVDSIKSALSSLGLLIENGVASVQKLVASLIQTQNLEIGTTENPSGFTIYDKTTKQPYCVGIDNGEFFKTPGKCEDTIQTQTTENPNTESQNTENQNTGTNSNTENSTSTEQTTTDNQTATSTDSTASSTEPVIEQPVEQPSEQPAIEEPASEPTPEPVPVPTPPTDSTEQAEVVPDTSTGVGETPTPPEADVGAEPFTPSVIEGPTETTSP